MKNIVAGTVIFLFGLGLGSLIAPKQVCTSDGTMCATRERMDTFQERTAAFEYNLEQLRPQPRPDVTP